MMRDAVIIFFYVQSTALLSTNAERFVKETLKLTNFSMLICHQY